MSTNNTHAKRTSLLFLTSAVVALWIGVFLGTVAAFQFTWPEFFEYLPFFKSRPLHVSLVIAWIFLCAIGGIYYYLPKFCDLSIHSYKLAKVHFGLFILTGFAIVGSYLAGRFGGKEYWAFPPVLSIPIVIAWIIFGYNFFRTVFKQKGPWPVYLWMWSTGVVFFFYTFLEANSWMLSFFSENLIKEITIQWKANGSLIGSWNMLVYGTAIFLMQKISGNEKMAYSNTAFFLYFVGLTNLMFGWAHHTYIVPSALWIRHLAYGISMTELIILGKIIWDWKNSLGNARKFKHIAAYRFLIASDIWIFLNLILAILISIPFINMFTHGTHITVAHSMGSTIGINSMILFASLFFLINEFRSGSLEARHSSLLNLGLLTSNFALFGFWICLILAGATKGVLTIEAELSFQEIMTRTVPYMIGFTITGLALFAGISMIVWVALKNLLRAWNNPISS